MRHEFLLSQPQPATTNATKCFQSLKGDSVDGIEGPMTRSSMCGYLKVRSPALYQETCP